MTIKSILRRSFINPFSIILISLAAISFVTDVLFASNFSRKFSTFIILLTMYLVSAAIRLVQELKSKRTADFLAALVETDVTVWRDGQWGQTFSSELKPGDKILLEYCMDILGILIFTALIYTPLGNFVRLYSLPPQYYIFLFAVAASYLGFMTVAKKSTLRKTRLCTRNLAFIRKLRKKVETNPDAPEYILTVWGIGYKFVE